MTTHLSPKKLLLQLSEHLSSIDTLDKTSYDEFVKLYYKMLTTLSNHGSTIKVAEDENANNNNESPIDLITPLLKFININSNYGQKDATELIYILARLIWYYHHHRSLLNLDVLLTVFASLPYNQFCQMNHIHQSEVVLNYTDYFMIFNFDTDINNKTNEYLKFYTSFVVFINRVIFQFQSIVENWYSNDMKNVNKVLLLMNDYPDGKIWVSLLFKNWKNTLNQPTNTIKIMEYLKLTDSTLISYYFQKNLPNSNDLQEWNLENFLKFILQILDHYQMTPNNVVTPWLFNYKFINKLQSCIGVIQTSSKFDIITEFNLLNCKVSFIMSLNYLNFIISQQILQNKFDDRLPDCVVQHFKSFQLPPLSKSNDFVIKSEFNDSNKSPSSASLDRIFTMIEQNDCSQSLIMIQFQILTLIDKLMLDECKSIEYINNQQLVIIADKTEDIDQKSLSYLLQEKIILSYLELFMVSLIAPLLLINNFTKKTKTSSTANGETQLAKQYQSDLIFQIFNKILNLNYKSLPKNKIWICLINIINDICYTDLRYIELFIELFEYQLSHHSITQNNKQNKCDEEKPDYLKDDLINSGLKFFIETFKPNHQWNDNSNKNNSKRQDSNSNQYQQHGQVDVENTPLYQIHLDDYKFLYSGDNYNKFNTSNVFPIHNNFTNTSSNTMRGK